MTALDAYKAMLRDAVGPALRELGCIGSAPRWRLATERGDYAVVEAQSSSSTTSSAVMFVVNIGVAPAVWLSRHGQTKKPASTDCLWRDRVNATREVASRPGDAWWLVTDEASAANAGADLIEQLRTTTVPNLRRLLDRPTLIEEMRQYLATWGREDRLIVAHGKKLATLLADEGPSEELDELLARIAAAAERDGRLEAVPAFLTWAREHAATRAGTS